MHEVFISVNSIGQPEWSNLPSKFEPLMAKYTNEEIVKDALACLNVIAVTLQGEQSVKQEIEKPTQTKFFEDLREATIFRKEDPSKHYAPLHKLGSGGQAAVYKVERLEDKK